MLATFGALQGDEEAQDSVLFASLARLAVITLYQVAGE